MARAIKLQTLYAKIMHSQPLHCGPKYYICRSMFWRWFFFFFAGDNAAELHACFLGSFSYVPVVMVAILNFLYVFQNIIEELLFVFAVKCTWSYSNYNKSPSYFLDHRQYNLLRTASTLQKCLISVHAISKKVK